MKFLRVFLWPVSLLWAIGAFTRNLMFKLGFRKQTKVSVPVISVGNIVSGGAGKTPTAFWLMEQLNDMGVRVAYLSRGYGRKTQGFLLVPPEGGPVETYGDEALMAAARYPHLPVAVCEDRVTGARRLIEDAHAEAIVLDDGFQHRRIQRDVDIVMVDGSRPLSRAVMPYGELREPLWGLNRATVIMLNKAHPREIYSQLKQLAPNALICRCMPKPVKLVPFFGGEEYSYPLKGLKVIAFSGLGNNEYFQSQLRGAGILSLDKSFSFPDHYVYSESDLTKIVNFHSPKAAALDTFAQASVIVTTEKDYHRMRDRDWLKRFKDYPLYYVRLEMTIQEGHETLREILEEQQYGSQH